jgi:hypothetical protein
MCLIIDATFMKKLNHTTLVIYKVAGPFSLANEETWIEGMGRSSSGEESSSMWWTTFSNQRVTLSKT